MTSVRLLPPWSRRLALIGSASLLVWLLGGAGARALADQAAPHFRMVVHPSNPHRAVARAFLADAFLKKTSRWEGGEIIRPVDLRPNALPRRLFTERVLKRSVGAVRSYWQQRIFSGRDVPPPELESDDDVLAFVAKHPGAIGYVSGATKPTGVKELSIE